MPKYLRHGVSASARARPLVGIPVCVEQARWRVWSGSAHLLGVGYADRVRRAGGVPVLLPAGGSSEEADELVGALDGLMLPGGADIHPDVYDQAPHPEAGPFDQVQDAWERGLLRAALDQGKAVFGICRGLQLLNVLLGGSLIQHLPDKVGSDVHNPKRGQFTRHLVRTVADSTLHQVIGPVAEVPTYHHQAVDVVAPGLTPVAWAEDGTVEALENSSGQIVAVQWHPEVGDSDALFDYFVGRCAGRLFEPSEPASPSPESTAQAQVVSAREEFVN